MFYLLIYLSIGFTITVILTFVDWNNGYDITTDHIVMIFWGTIILPIPILLLFSLLTDSEYTLIKGRKK